MTFIYLVGLALAGLVSYAMVHSVNIIYLERFLNPQYLIPIVLSVYTIGFAIIAFVVQRVKFTLNNLFILMMTISIIVFCIAGILTHGEACRSLLHPYKEDVFMDFFNSIQYGFQPYENQVIYPPFINLLYAILGKMTLIDVTHDPMKLRVTQMGAMVYLIYTLVLVTVYVFLCHSFYGHNKKSYLFTIVTLLSAPFLYALERGNSIILALVLVLYFLKYYKSSQKIIRYLSYVALGLAVGIKITPAVFGILILRRQRLTESIIAIIIGLVTFMIPFSCLDGGIMALLHNIQYTTSIFQGISNNFPIFNSQQMTGQGVYINVQNTFRFISRILNINLYEMGTFTNVLVFSLGLIEALFVKSIRFWQLLFIITGLMILSPGFSCVYNAIFLVIPLLFLLTNNEVSRKTDFIYIIAFTGIFAPLINLKLGIFSSFMADSYPMVLSTALESIFILLLMVAIEIENLPGVLLILGKRFSLKLWALILITASLGGYYLLYKTMPKEIYAFTPYNAKEVHAIMGIAMEHGLYKKIENKAGIILKSDQVVTKGLQISFGSSNDAGIQHVGVFVNGNELRSINIDSSKNSYLYIKPEELIGKIDGNSFLLEIKNYNAERGRALNLNYAGPAKPLPYVAKDIFIYDSAYGFVRNSLKLEKESHFLLDNSKLEHGFIVKLDISGKLYSHNMKKLPVLHVLGNGKLLKTITVIHPGELGFAVQPNEIARAWDNLETNKVLQLTLLFETEQSNSGNMGSFASLEYIGTPADQYHKRVLPLYQHFLKPWYAVHLPKDTFDSNVEFFDSKALEKDGLAMILLIPEDRKYMNDSQPIDVELLLNDELYVKRTIKGEGFGRLIPMSVPSEIFAGDNYIVKAEMRVTNANNLKIIKVTDEKLLPFCKLMYWGPSDRLVGLKNLDKLETQWQSQGLLYDQWTKHWIMGARADIVMYNKRVQGGYLELSYQVSPYLFKANPNQKDIQLLISVNGELVDVIPLVSEGSFQAIIPEEVLSKVVDSSGVSVITLNTNATYNLADMGELAYKNENRSIDIVSLEYINNDY